MPSDVENQLSAANGAHSSSLNPTSNRLSNLLVVQLYLVTVLDIILVFLQTVQTQLPTAVAGALPWLIVTWFCLAAAFIGTSLVDASYYHTRRQGLVARVVLAICSAFVAWTAHLGQAPPVDHWPTCFVAGLIVGLAYHVIQSGSDGSSRLPSSRTQEPPIPFQVFRPLAAADT